ncbi:MAG TPA: acyl carrier protein [Chitinivibrionales bacterium]
MSEPTIEARVKAVITEVLKIDQSRLVKTAKFKEDLGADSLDLASMLMALEEEFKGSISDEEAKTMTTVGSAIETITRLSASPSFTSR